MGTRFCASYLTLAGCRYGEPTRHHLLQRADAAAAAGIREIGACAAEMGLLTSPDSFRHLAYALHGIRVPEIEWVDLSLPRDGHNERQLFMMADAFRSTRLNVGVCGTAHVPHDVLTQRLRHLALRAADHGLTIAVEPVCFGSLGKPGDVAQIVADCGEPNVGLLLDVYHSYRAAEGDLLVMSRGLDADMIVEIQLSGVNEKPTGDLFTDCQDHRRLPGEGDPIIPHFLAATLAQNPAIPISVEVISTELRGLDLNEAAQRVYDTTTKVLSTGAVGDVLADINRLYA
jgi:sugar phosphate isomerase/epimerase